MQLIETYKRRYLESVKKHLANKHLPKEDIHTILEGLSEHIDEEVWRQTQENKNFDKYSMEDLLSNLELPEDILTEEVSVVIEEPAEQQLFHRSALVSCLLSLSIFPIFFMVGYWNHELAFDLLVAFTLCAVVLALLGIKSRFGKQALLISGIPLITVLGFILFALQ